MGSSTLLVTTNHMANLFRVIMMTVLIITIDVFGVDKQDFKMSKPKGMELMSFHFQHHSLLDWEGE